MERDTEREGERERDAVRKRERDIDSLPRCLLHDLQVVETSQRYDSLCMPNMSRSMAEYTLASHQYDGVPCTIPLYIPKKMRAPVYLYYEIKNFYQNHRRYVKVRRSPHDELHSLLPWPSQTPPRAIDGGH